LPAERDPLLPLPFWFVIPEPGVALLHGFIVKGGATREPYSFPSNKELKIDRPQK
jgi:hypothetical protein